MNPYFTPPSGMQATDAATALLTMAPVSPSRFSRAMDTRTSQRFFAADTLDPTAVTALTGALVEFQAAHEGIRFVNAVRTGPHRGHLSPVGSRSATDIVTVDDWDDLYLQGEYASAPLVIVAVIGLTDGWRAFEQRMIASTAALTSVWLDRLNQESNLEGSVFAGVLGGWLRLHGLIGADESPGVALALGTPAAPTTPSGFALAGAASTPTRHPITHSNTNTQGETQ